MSRRARQRATARPWQLEQELPPAPPDRDDDSDTVPFYLANGDRVDHRSVWQRPAQPEAQR